jgi:hypothetical protein
MERTMPQKPKDPAPAAEKPAYTIVKQTKSRWWEVRDPNDELVCLTVYRKGSRGRDPCGCRDALTSGLTTQGSGVRGRRAGPPPAENMDGPASPAADC